MSALENLFNSFYRSYFGYQEEHGESDGDPEAPVDGATVRRDELTNKIVFAVQHCVPERCSERARRDAPASPPV